MGYTGRTKCKQTNVNKDGIKLPFIRFVNSILKSHKPQVKALLHRSINDVRSTTGGNLRDILINTGVKVFPGVTIANQVSKYMVYKIPENNEWKIPLLISLLEIREDRWEILFDEESTEGKITRDDITTMIDDLCIS